MDATFYAVWFDGSPDEADKVTTAWPIAKEWFDQTGKATVFAFNPVEGWSRDVTDEFLDDPAS